MPSGSRDHAARLFGCILACILLLASGCAGFGPTTSKEGGDKGAELGFAAGLGLAQGCTYLFFIVCAPITIPIGVVAGAASGAIWGAINESSPPPPPARREPPHVTAANSPRWTDLQFVGIADGSGPLPAGTLHIGTTEQLGDRHKKWLVVDLAQPTPRGERSFAVATVPNCWTEKLTLAYYVTYAGALGEGEQVSAQSYQPQLEITQPDELLLSAIRSVCTFRDKVRSAVRS